MKYRVRISSGRVLGPFEEKDFTEMIDRFYLTGNEEYQEFPLGDWENLSSFSNLKKIFESKSEFKQKDETFMLNLNDMMKEDVTVDSKELENITTPKEFEYDQEDPFELEETLENVSGNGGTEDEYIIETDDVDKTVVKKRLNLDEDKTRINPEYQKYLKEQLEKEKKAKELEELERKKRAFEKEVEIVEPDYDSAKTEMINIKDLKKGLESALEIEESLEVIEKKKKQKKAKSLQDTDIKTEETKKGSSVKRVIIILMILGMGFAVLFPEKKVERKLKKITILNPKFMFPVRNSMIDKEQANNFYLKGNELYYKNHFKAYLLAAKNYEKSLEHSFDNNPSGAKLILMYSLMLKNSTNFAQDSKVVYNLVQYFKKFSYSDPTYAAAIANYYLVANKRNAAINILDRYLAVESNKPTKLLYAVYLKALSEKGDFEKTESIVKALEGKTSKELEVYKSLYEYYKDHNLIEKQLALLKEAQANKFVKKSTYFLLEKSELFLKEGDLTELRELIFKINSREAENSRIYYAKYLKLLGLYYAAKKNYAKAVEFVKKSIEVYELDDLIGELAVIEDTDNKLVNEMIKLSKVKLLLRVAKEQLSENETTEAFKRAVQATELLPKNIDARILLSKIQIKKGYYDDALRQLKNLYEENRDNMRVLYELINLYVEMYQFRSAEEHLQAILDKTTWEYASVRAKLYRVKKEYGLGISWLGKAINLNQLDEENIFSLAKFYIQLHKYNKAKHALNKVMDLDPFNTKYKITYAKILYEVETSASAIGYLYDVLKDFPDNPHILSEIGIYYYKSGQVKNYENIKDKLSTVSAKDSTLFRFLVESAKLEDDFEKIIKNSKKILEIEPGDLETRLYLAEIYMLMRKFKLAKEQLDEIKKRFQNYPKLNYFYARFYLLINDIDTAISLALKEHKKNPGVVSGSLLLGDIYKKKKELLTAKKYYMMSIQIDAKNVDAILGLAYIAFHSNQFDLAIDQYQKAISIEPNRAESYKLLGDVYKRLGQSQPAVKNYKHFLELSPNYRYKDNLRNYIQKIE